MERREEERQNMKEKLREDKENSRLQNKNRILENER